MRNLLPVLLLPIFLSAQSAAPPSTTSSSSAAAESSRHGTAQILKAVDDLMWHIKLGDIAEVDKSVFTSTPKHYVPDRNAPGALDPALQPR